MSLNYIVINSYCMLANCECRSYSNLSSVLHWFTENLLSNQPGSIRNTPWLRLPASWRGGGRGSSPLAVADPFAFFLSSSCGARSLNEFWGKVVSFNILNS